MNENTIGRRKLLQFIGASAGLAMVPGPIKSMTLPEGSKKFSYCLNTATVRGHELGLMKELETASKAGFTGVEIWMDTLQTYLDKGGSVAEIRRRLNDLGLKVEGAIGFAEWIVDDDDRRNKGIEQLKKEMDLLASIGCKRTAAPPAGATQTPGLDLRKAAERYRTILELGEKTGVIPNLELWGFSANLNKLSEVMFVAIESGHPKAKLLLDNYHLYKGGSSPASVALVNPEATEVFHVNDYPSTLPPATITDADRTYPGDGVSPLRSILKSLSGASRPLVISVEVFNKKYYSQDALVVAKTAIKKMKEVTQGI
jgi:sugar phosphate isomerase/epimerase